MMENDILPAKAQDCHYLGIDIYFLMEYIIINWFSVFLLALQDPG